MTGMTSAGVEPGGPVLRLDSQCLEYFGRRSVAQSPDPIDVGCGQACVVDRGAHGLERQLQPGDAGAAADA